ncbi:MAG: hypothetical protein AAF485_26815 [Chloroflexota bacterium]
MTIEALVVSIGLGLLLVGSGIYAIINAEIPGMVFGDKGYKTEGTGARVIGALLLVPPVLMFFLNFFIGFLSIVVVLFAVYFINKAVRKPVS